MNYIPLTIRRHMKNEKPKLNFEDWKMAMQKISEDVADSGKLKILDPRHPKTKSTNIKKLSTRR